MIVRAFAWAFQARAPLAVALRARTLVYAVAACAAAAVCFGAAGSAQAASIFGIDQSGIYQIDTVSGATSKVTTFTTAFTDLVPATGESTSGIMYFLEGSGNNQSFYTYNTNTPTVQPLLAGSTGLADYLPRMAVQPNGVIWAMSTNNNLYTLSASTGATMLVGGITGIPAGLGGDIAFGPGGALYVGAGASLFTVPTASGGGAATLAGNLNTPTITGLAFDPSNTAYTSDSSGNLYRITGLPGPPLSSSTPWTSIVLPSGDSLGDLASQPVPLTAGPALAVSKTDNGPWTSQSSAIYSVTVSNGGTVATSGTITVTDTLPGNLTATANPNGTGWTCTGGGTNTLSCTSTTIVAAGSNAAVITIPVTIGPGTPGSVTNTVFTYGGGDPNHGTAATAVSGSRVTTLNIPSLTVAKVDNGPWTLGQLNAQYTITLSNTGTGATVGAVTVTDTLPAQLTANGVPNPGAGNTCTVTGGTQISCALNTSIAGGGQATILVPVNIGAGTPSSVINTATAYGGGDPVHTSQGTAAVGSVTTAVGSLSAANLALGPELNASATGSYDGVVLQSNMNDFTATNVQRGGAAPQTNPNGSGVPMNVTLATGTAPCIPHTFAITGKSKQISVTGVAPASWQVGLYSDTLCATLYSGSIVGNTTTAAIGNISANAEVYAKYTTSSPISIVPFQRYDAPLYAYETGHLGDKGSNNTHDELYYGFVPVVKTQTILTSTCPGGTGLCPGSILRYTLTYSNSLPGNYITTEGGLSPRPFPYAVPLSLNEDGTTGGSWGAVGGLTAAPTDTTAGTTYTYTKNGVGTVNPVGATQFTATVAGAGYAGLTPASSGTITFTVTVK